MTIGGIVCNGAPISPPTNLSWVAAAENHVDLEVDGVIYPICSWRTCRFFGIDSTGVALRYYWDFGDGTTGTGPFVGHAYARPDRLRQFTVKLTVVDAFGRSSTAARDFYLHPVY